jgi:hypothetical protein
MSVRQMWLLPIIVGQVVLDMNDQSIPPICFDKRTGELAVEDHHFTSNTIWRQHDIVDREIVLHVRSKGGSITVTVRPVLGVFL